VNSIAKQELQIIQAFSHAEVPESIIQESNIRDLVRDMVAEQAAAKSDANNLERLRQEKKNGNFIGNWWNDRSDKVQDAQIDLSKTIGRLTQKSSQLLIVNTAISKVLNDQQNILLQQQTLLKQQTNKLEEQNIKILEQQQLLARQQREINAANQGLMEAKGITQEQAQKLVGCVVRVTEAERKIETKNQELRTVLEGNLRESVALCTREMNSVLSTQSRRQDDFENAVHKENLSQAQKVSDKINKISKESDQLKIDLQEKIQHHIQATDNNIQTQVTTIEQMHKAFYAQWGDFQNELTSGIKQQTQSICDTVSAIEARLEQYQREQTLVLEENRNALTVDLERISTGLDEKTQLLTSLESRLLHVVKEQDKNYHRSRTAFFLATSLALASLAWQIAQRFAAV
jgi:hypothetical protein